MPVIPNYQITKSSFELAKNATRLQIPQKFYGRENELKTLFSTFNRVVKGKSKITLINGHSGIGKSTLVKEFYKLLADKPSHFITGKIDQSQLDIPYSAIITALEELVEQLLTENIAQLAQWKDKLLAVLGTNGQIIVEVIPKLELIIGKQPVLPKLATTESQNRFNLVLHDFMRIFCQPKQPLVIFLDNLQWVDLATLQFLDLVMTNKDANALFLIGTFQDNEVASLTATLDILEKTKVTINKISLKPLASLYISQLIADSLHLTSENLESMVNLVMHNTEGNPSFVNQFLHALFEENLEEKYSQLSANLSEHNKLEQKFAECTQELHDAHAHIKVLQTKLIESEKTVSLVSLIANVNSQLNTPIGIGVTGASVITDRTTEIETLFDNKELKASALKNYFDIIMRSSKLVLSNLIHAAKLVQSFRQIVFEQINLTKRSFAIEQYIENTLICLTPPLKKDQYQVTISGGKQLEIDSYPGAFSQVVTNLVMNSVKHAYPTQELGHLHFELCREPERLILKYSDDGCGIPTGDLNKIFEPFFTTNQGDIGLGLYIVNNLVTQKLQGTIWVESEINIGTTFILDLPIRI